MVHSIVTHCGGSIEVETECGRGTAMHLLFPVCEARLEPAGGAEIPKPAGGTETVLVVEDEAKVRHLACSVLDGYGYRVLSAADGEQALAECALERVDLLITDLVMPRMSGVELVTLALARQPELKILYISGYSDEVAERYGGAVAGELLVRKPFSADQLAGAVRQALDTPGSPAPAPGPPPLAWATGA